MLGVPHVDDKKGQLYETLNWAFANEWRKNDYVSWKMPPMFG